MSRLRIGVFDSGLGGLTVLRSLLDTLPGCDYVYLGDTARLPYGSKSASTIESYSGQNLQFLEQKNVDVMIIACNTASAYWKEEEFNKKPVVTVIGPTLKAALAQSVGKKLGVLATRATVNSQIYKKTLQSLDPEAEIWSMAAPLLVPFAEEGLFEDPLTNLVTYRYTQPLVATGIDTLILGCTHYPLLKASIQKAAGHIPLIESGPAVSESLRKFFDMKKKEKKEKPQIEIFLTDEMTSFRPWAEKILGPYQAQSWNSVIL